MDDQIPLWLQGTLDDIAQIDQSVGAACRTLYKELFPIKKKKRKPAENAHSLLVQAVKKHLDTLNPVQEAIKTWLACYDQQKSEYLLSKELSKYNGSPRLMLKWQVYPEDSPFLFRILDFLVYMEDDLISDLNVKETKKIIKKKPVISCYFCWRGIDSPSHYCSHHTQVNHPTIYARFQGHLKRMGVWKKISDRTGFDYLVPYYRRSGPGLSGEKVEIFQPIDFRWTNFDAPSVIRNLMPKAASRMEGAHCWEALKEGWEKFVEKTLAAFESESREEMNILLNNQDKLRGRVLWVILVRYELWSRWWERHPFPGRGTSSPRRTKVNESLVQKYLSEGLPKTEIAKRTGLSRQAVYKIINRLEPKTNDHDQG